MEISVEEVVRMLAMLDEIEEAVELQEIEIAALRELVKELERENDRLEAFNEALQKSMELYEKTIKNLERRAKRNGVSEIFTQKQIDSINELYYFWHFTQEEIAQKLGTSQQRISEVITRQVTKGKDK